MRDHTPSVTLALFAALLCLCGSAVHSAPAAQSSNNLDFDLLMKQAPVLDMDASAFDEIKAEAWHEETANLYQKTFSEASQEYRSAAISFALESINKQYDNKEKLVRYRIVGLQKLPAKGHPERFLKRFAIEYDKDNLLTFQGLNCIEEVLTSVGMADSAGKSGIVDLTREFKSKMSSVPIGKRKAAVEKVCAHIKKIRLTIYKPTPGSQDIIVRKHVCKMLKDLADMVEDTMKPGGQ